MKSLFFYISLLIVLLFAVDGNAQGGSSTLPESGAMSKEAFYDKVASLDSLLFDAFNRRDTVLFGAMMSRDLEFFHDLGGLTGYTETMNFIKTNRENNSDLQRRRVPGTLEVYPIPGYGALQTGVHEFCHTENGAISCGRFKFVHVWKLEGKTWKLTRVLSYGH